MKIQRNAFTLIELLVVISIIALMLSIVMPSLTRAKEKARELICKSNLHQWNIVFLAYAHENDDKFWMEYTPASGLQQGQWMPVLAPYYGNIDKLRLCPSASKANKFADAVGIGTEKAYWGEGGDGGDLAQKFNLTRNSDSLNKNFSSYGINLWINDVTPPTHVGWRDRPQYHWRTVLQAKASQIPVLMDCTWFGASPDNPDVDLTEDPLEVTSRSYWSERTYSTVNWSNDIARLLIARHDFAINMCLMDGSAKEVDLEDLWVFKWHKEFKAGAHRIELNWRTR